MAHLFLASPGVAPKLGGIEPESAGPLGDGTLGAWAGEHDPARAQIERPDRRQGHAGHNPRGGSRIPLEHSPRRMRRPVGERAHVLLPEDRPLEVDRHLVQSDSRLADDRRATSDTGGRLMAACRQVDDDLAHRGHLDLAVHFPRLRNQLVGHRLPVLTRRDAEHLLDAGGQGLGDDGGVIAPSGDVLEEQLVDRIGDRVVLKSPLQEAADETDVDPVALLSSEASALGDESPDPFD